MLALGVWEDIILFQLEEFKFPKWHGWATWEPIVQTIALACAWYPEHWRDLTKSILETVFTTATLDSDEMIDAASKDIVLTLRKRSLSYIEFQDFTSECDFDKITTIPVIEAALLCRSEKIIDMAFGIFGRIEDNLALSENPNGELMPARTIGSHSAQLRCKQPLMPLLVKLYNSSTIKSDLLMAMSTSVHFVDWVYPLVKETGFLKWNTEEEAVLCLRWLPIEQLELFNEDAPLVVTLIKVLSMMRLEMPWNEKMNNMYRYLNGWNPDWFDAVMRYPVTAIINHIIKWIREHDGLARPESLLMIKTKWILYQLWFVKREACQTLWWPLFGPIQMLVDVYNALEMDVVEQFSTKKHYCFLEFLVQPWPHDEYEQTEVREFVGL